MPETQAPDLPRDAGGSVLPCAFCAQPCNLAVTRDDDIPARIEEWLEDGARETAPVCRRCLKDDGYGLCYVCHRPADTGSSDVGECEVCGNVFHDDDDCDRGWHDPKSGMTHACGACSGPNPIRGDEGALLVEALERALADLDSGRAIDARAGVAVILRRLKTIRGE